LRRSDNDLNRSFGVDQAAFRLPLLDWIAIPKGSVVSDLESEPITILPFKMAKYPVTNAQFQVFIDDGGYQADRYWRDLSQRENTPGESRWNEPILPRDRVNWYEAIAFARWLSEKTGLVATLPSEWQWQWAAVGDTGWAYPYGESFDPDKANTSESRILGTTPVDRYSGGASPFGVLDMSGNLYEWCLNVTTENTRQRIIRGGAWDYPMHVASAAFRGVIDANSRVNFVGFRVIALQS
jgi:formylglycine-generating enzyme required for sulfatase activity